jgi:hypothetical protein
MTWVLFAFSSFHGRTVGRHIEIALRKIDEAAGSQSARALGSIALRKIDRRLDWEGGAGAQRQ